MITLEFIKFPMPIPRDILFEIWKRSDIVTKRSLAISCEWLSQKEEIKNFNLHIKQQISKVNTKTFYIADIYELQQIQWKNTYGSIYFDNEKIAVRREGTASEINDDDYGDDDYSGGDWVFIHYTSVILPFEKCIQTNKVAEYLKYKKFLHRKSDFLIQLYSKVDFVKELYWLYLYGCL